ncbi:MAG: hypothetical protein V1874_02810 [Spirochaetota bacterium]
MKIRKNYLLLCVLFFISIITACSDSSGSSDSPGNSDTTAPEWNAGYPKAIDIDDRIYVKASLNENGNVYCVLRRDGDPAPSVQDIANGLGEFAVNAEVSADAVNTLIFKDLSYSNAFDLYCVGVDDSNNMQVSAVKIDILTSTRNTVFVSQIEGNDINMGSISYPKKTIASALAYAKANWPFTMSRKICVSQGTYDESVELTEGISLLGGYSSADWSERNSALYTSTITGASGQNYVLSITGTNQSSEDWIVERLLINTDKSSVLQGIKCNAESLVLIRNNEIHGGFAANEATAVYLYGNANTEILTNSIVGGISETGDTCGIMVETSGDQLIKDNSIFGGDGYTNMSCGIKITQPVDYDTIIINNNINAGVAHNTCGIYITHDSDNETSMPVIYGNRITGGSGNDQYVLYLFGTADTRAVSPVICNNIIENGTSLAPSDVFSLGIIAIDGYAYLYNNIIIGNSDSAGVIIAGDTGRESRLSAINNIIIGMELAIVETDSFSFCDVLKNNDLYNCTYFLEPFGEPGINSVNDLNAFHTDFGNNISVDALLDSQWNFTASSPASVTEGGLDLSAYPYFQENASGQKIDITGKVRTAPWSIGAYEKE